jgi:hypothetical protein
MDFQKKPLIAFFMGNVDSVRKTLRVLTSDSAKALIIVFGRVRLYMNLRSPNHLRVKKKVWETNV